MSNYYNDQYKPNQYRYSDLKHVDDYSCNHECTCRDSSERSDRDKMNYNFYVLGKPMNLENAKIVPESFRKKQ
jgi:hypothetical protein